MGFKINIYRHVMGANCCSNENRTTDGEKESSKKMN